MVRYRQGKKYKALALGHIVKALGGQLTTWPRFKHIVVHATFYTWNEMDQDNLTARIKDALDALVDARLVEDDSPKYLTLVQPSQYIDRKNQRLELVIDGEPHD